MKSKTFIVSFLLLFLSTTIFTSCEAVDIQDETFETETEKIGVDKDIERPGNQGSRSVNSDN